MERCTECGALRNTEYLFCPVCGLPFTDRKPAKVRRTKNPYSSADRKALAGFLVSFFGLLTIFSAPVQLVGLLLSLSARGTSRCKALRIFGIVLSAVGLALSALVWTEFFLHAEEYLYQIMKSMYY